MAQSNFPKGFANGVTVRGLPLLQTHPGKVFWVSNASTAQLPGQKTGSNGNKGTFDAPFATIDYAVGQCQASRGDIIVVKPGHAESIANATTLLLDVAGVAIVGLGSGSLRPTLTFTTATTANIPVSAANVSINNILFVANFLDIVSVFTTAAAPEFSVENCEFRDGASVNFITIVTTTVSVDANGLNFSGNKVYGLGTTAATTPIKVAGTMDRLTINDNIINLGVVNNTSAVLAHGALVVTNLQMRGNEVFRLNTDTATGGILVTTSSTTNTGMISENYVKCLDVAALIMVTAGSIYGMSENYVAGDADNSGIILPAAFNNS